MTTQIREHARPTPEDCQRVLAALSREPAPVYAIAATVGLSAQCTLSALTLLELEGKARQSGDKRFALRAGDEMTALLYEARVERDRVRAHRDKIQARLIARDTELCAIRAALGGLHKDKTLADAVRALISAS